MDWQPIETAPKDGTIIRLYIPGHPELEGIKGRWDDYNREWCPAVLTYTLSNAMDVPDPTMWMP